MEGQWHCCLADSERLEGLGAWVGPWGTFGLAMSIYEQIILVEFVSNILH